MNLNYYFKYITNFIFIGEDILLINLLSINLILPLIGIFIVCFIAATPLLFKKKNYNNFIIQKNVAL
jgi:hypothetical protein